MNLTPKQHDALADVVIESTVSGTLVKEILREYHDDAFSEKDIQDVVFMLESVIAGFDIEVAIHQLTVWWLGAKSIHRSEK